MKDIKIPGSAWIIVLAIINTLPVALQDAFPGAVWVPLAVDLLLVAAKAVQVYMPKGAAAPAGDVHPANFVAPEAPVAERSKLRSFLMG